MTTVEAQPYIDLCLSILALAKKDASSGRGKSNEMWTDFQRSHDMTNRNVDGFAIALWVSQWIADH